MNYPATVRLPLALFVTAAARALTSAAFAQSTPPTTSATATAAAAKEEAVELSPFVVSGQAESGYAATNTMEGSRLNTPLRDTPGSVSIFTKDLLDDLGATTMDEILRYDLSAELSYGDNEAQGIPIGIRRLRTP